MVLVIGEILVDIFPGARRIGGAPFNFSYHLSRFGLPVRFISRIGSDETGKEIRAFLARNGFDASGIQVDASHPTGHVMVHPDGAGGHRFEIVADTAYDYIELPASPEAAAGQRPRMIYFGTLIQRTPRMFKRVQRLLDRRDPETKCFCDINLRPGCYSAQVVVESLRQADILKINDEEIERVGGMLGGSMPGGDELVGRLMEHYDIEMVSLTLGERGSRLYTRAGRYETGVSPSGPVGDSVGAGDAYAAVVALGCLKNWRPEGILSEASAFAGQICQIQGAIPGDPSFYDAFVNRLTGEAYAG